MTNLALAISLDPHFPELAQELVFMGGSLSPQTDNPEFLNNPRHEFNFWFDPEAAEIVLRAPWKKIVCTPTDISVKTHLTAALVKQIEASGTPLARYIAHFAMLTPGADIMWDELAAAAWIDIIGTTRALRRMVVAIHSWAGGAQCREAREQLGRGRYSLWTGDTGLAVYLRDCLVASPRLLTVDVF